VEKGANLLVSLVLPKLIESIFGLALIAVFIPLAYYVMEQAHKGKEIYLRRLEALDGINLAIDKAAEAGKPVYVEIGGQLTGEYFHMVAAALGMLPFIARRCARLGVKILTAYHAPQVLPQIIGILTSSAKAEGKDPSFFPRTDIELHYGGDMIGAFIGQATVEANDCRASICIGRVALQALSQLEANKGNGCISIQGTSFMNQIHVIGLLPDYSMVGEELYTASASISGDVESISILRAQDLLKWFSVAITLIMIIALRMGVKGL